VNPHQIRDQVQSTLIRVMSTLMRASRESLAPVNIENVSRARHSRCSYLLYLHSESKYIRMEFLMSQIAIL
jgi:hypothetical protein